MPGDWGYESTEKERIYEIHMDRRVFAGEDRRDERPQEGVELAPLPDRRKSNLSRR